MKSWHLAFITCLVIALTFYLLSAKGVICLLLNRSLSLHSPYYKFALFKIITPLYNMQNIPLTWVVSCNEGGISGNKILLPFSPN